jgi:hypothetical protein
MRSAADLTTAELIKRTRQLAERYSSNRYRGNTFQSFAALVTELSDRLGDAEDISTAITARLREEIEPQVRAKIAREQGTHTEYAPVLGNGLVMDVLAVAEPDTLDGRLRRARREVTKWRYDDGTLVH